MKRNTIIEKRPQFLNELVLDGHYVHLKTTTTNILDNIPTFKFERYWLNKEADAYNKYKSLYKSMTDIIIIAETPEKGKAMTLYRLLKDDDFNISAIIKPGELESIISKTKRNTICQVNYNDKSITINLGFPGTKYELNHTVSSAEKAYGIINLMI